MFGRPKPTAGCSANGRRRGSVTNRQALAIQTDHEMQKKSNILHNSRSHGSASFCNRQPENKHSLKTQCAP